MKAALDPGSERDEAIERLMRTWQTPLLRLCYVQLRDRTLAEDAVQETFVKAYRNWEQFRGESSEKNWLCKIAVNVCRDMQRGGWFRHTDRTVTPDMLPPPIAPAREDRVDLTLAVMDLPVRYREAIMLYYYQDMNLAEIAKVLGVAPSNVSMRLKKGRELLRRALEGRNPD